MELVLESSQKNHGLGPFQDHFSTYYLKGGQVIVIKSNRTRLALHNSFLDRYITRQPCSAMMANVPWVTKKFSDEPTLGYCNSV